MAHNPKGACHVCGKFGHFARECGKPEVPSPTLFFRDLAPTFELEHVPFLSSLPGFVNARIRTDRSNTAVSFVDYDSADAALNAKRLAEGRGLGVQFAASSTKDPARAGAAAVSAGNDRMKRQRDGGGYEHQHGGGGRMWGGDGFGGGMHAGPGMHGAHAGAGYGPPMGAGLGMMGAMGLHGSMMGHAGPRMPMGADAMGARGGGAYDRGHNDGWESARDDFRQPQQLSEPAPSGGSSQAVALSVEGAPADATKRELSHIFRSCPGYLLTLVTSDGGFVVKFNSMASAAGAIARTKDYKLDEEEPHSATIRLTFSQAR